MDTSNILSRLMIGENQLSVRKRGYEITKNVLAILSPRLTSLGVIWSADGAMTSWNSSVAALYISDGKIGAIFACFAWSDFFLLNISHALVSFIPV